MTASWCFVDWMRLARSDSITSSSEISVCLNDEDFISELFLTWLYLQRKFFKQQIINSRKCERLNNLRVEALKRLCKHSHFRELICRQTGPECQERKFYLVVRTADQKFQWVSSKAGQTLLLCSDKPA